MTRSVRRKPRREPSAAPARPSIGVLTLIVAAGGHGITRKALGRRTRLQAARMDRIVGLLADRGLVSQQIEPGSGYRPATRYSARPQGLTATYRDGGFE